jgi:peptidyl-prolyl cis-trans isomerase SurA
MNNTFKLLLTFILTTSIGAVEILDRVAIIVGDGVVLESQVNKLLETIKGRITSQGIAMPEEDALLDSVHERLIIEELQLQMGNRAGIRISDAELNSAIANIAQANQLSLDEFVSDFSNRDQSYEEFRNQLRRELIIQRVQRGRVSSSVDITEQEVSNFLASQEAQDQLYPEYQVSQILLPDLETANKVLFLIESGMNFESLAKDFSTSSNASNGGNLGFRKLSNLPSMFSKEVKNESIGYVSKPLKTGAGYQIIKLTDKRGALLEYEEQWKVRHILMSPSQIRDDVFTKKELEEVRERLMNGESFELLAKEFSEDPGSGSNGGDLDWLPRGVTDPNFEKTFTEIEKGIISPVFETQFGYHFLEVLDSRTYEKTFDNIENQAYNILFSRKFDEELENTLRTMRAEAFVEFKDLD